MLRCLFLACNCMFILSNEILPALFILSYLILKRVEMGFTNNLGAFALKRAIAWPSLAMKCYILVTFTLKVVSQIIAVHSFCCRRAIAVIYAFQRLFMQMVFTNRWNASLLKYFLTISTFCVIVVMKCY